MSINQASIHYNLPYSSLYGRFRRGKYEADHPDHEDDNTSGVDVQTNSQSIVQHAEMQQEPQTSSQSQPQQSTIQPQIMLLQYQHTPTTHIQMYQPAAPS